MKGVTEIWKGDVISTILPTPKYSITSLALQCGSSSKAEGQQEDGIPRSPMQVMELNSVVINSKKMFLSYHVNKHFRNHINILVR